MAMTNTNRQVFYDRIVDAMQPCEEVGGPEGLQYVAVMTSVAQEAMRRVHNAVADMERSGGRCTMCGLPPTECEAPDGCDGRGGAVRF